MALKEDIFGRTGNGAEIKSFTLQSETGLRAVILEYGAVVQSLCVPTPTGDVETVIGYKSVAEYEGDWGCHGAIIGRYANRIANAKFDIGYRTYNVTPNEGAHGNCLHGGEEFNKAKWTAISADNNSVMLAYVSKDKEYGFPGNVVAYVNFKLEGNMLCTAYEATTDRTTPLNLTHHHYFNLSGGEESILDHWILVSADTITPVNAKKVPTGKWMPVHDTPFDLRQLTHLGGALKGRHPQLELGSNDEYGGFDRNWELERQNPAVMLESFKSDIRLAVSTDHPCTQIYTSHGDGPKRKGGIAIEPQGFPDAPNQPAFPNSLLYPHKIYRRENRYHMQCFA